MKLNLRAPISSSIAIAVGFLVLLGYFFDFGLLTALRRVFLQWAVILAAIAMMVGVANLFAVHWTKIKTWQAGSGYSLILLLSLLITLMVVGFFGPTGSWTLWLFNYIEVPIESSLMAILAIALAYASARLLRRRMNPFSAIFLFTALIVLLATVPILGIELPGLHGPDGIRSLITGIFTVAGARGILLGIVLGTVATALRIIMGIDRPYSE